MRAQLLFLLLLAAVCYGLQPSLQYRYQYRARLYNVIPEINEKQGTFDDIRGELAVYVPTEGTVIFRLEGIEIGHYQGNNMSCCPEDLHMPLPVEYLSVHELLSHSTFGQHHFAMVDGAFKFHQDDPLWLRNYYKSILSLFNIPAIQDPQNFAISESYEKDENTVMGNCKTTYTQHKLSGVALSQLEDIDEDCQREPTGPIEGPPSKGPGRKVPGGRKVPRRGSKTSKTSPVSHTSCPQINSNGWQVVRSVNLDRCEESVEVQFSLGGVYCDLSSDQCKNLLSRNSHGVFKLRGDLNGMRLESAETKGAIVFSPYGFATEHPQSITRQSLQLKSVTPLSQRDTPDMDWEAFVTRTLLSEVIMPYHGTTEELSWAISGTWRDSYAGYAGSPITTKENGAQAIVTIIEQAMYLKDGHHAYLTPEVLNWGAFLMAHFEQDEIESLVTTHSTNPVALNLLWDMLAETGTPEAVNVLIGAAKHGKISALRQVMIFASLNTNIKSAASLKPLFEFLESQPIEETPFKTSQSMINFASMVNRLCLSYGRDVTSRIDRNICAQDQVLETFQQYLIHLLEGTDSEMFWKQMVLVQSLVNLRTIGATNALLPYVLGHKPCDTMVRTLAMDSLAKWNAPSLHLKSQITLILLDILENPSEHRLLRARALGFIVSWPLSSTAWTRLAFLTKKPGNKDLAALTYSIIKSTAGYAHPEMIQQKQYASHALTLAKPATAGERHSSFNIWVKYNFADQIGAVNYFEAIRDPTSPLPSELSVFLRRSLGGALFYRKLEMMISNDDGDLEMMAIKIFLDKHWTPSDRGTTGRWTNFINQLKTDLHITEKVRGTIRGMLSLLPLQGVHFMVPLQHEIIIDAMKAISDGAPYFQIAEGGSKGFYFNSVGNVLATTNDLGLATISYSSRPTYTQQKGIVHFDQSGPDKYRVSGDQFDIYSIAVTKTSVETFTPWSESAVIVGSSNSKYVKFPFNPLITVQLPIKTTNYENDGFITIDLTPSSESEATTLYQHDNIPYIGTLDATTTDFTALGRGISGIYSGKRNIELNIPIPGIGGGLSYNADPSHGSIESFFNPKEFVIEKFVTASSLAVLNTQVIVDLAALKGKTLSLALRKIHLDRKSGGKRYVSQYGQDSFEDYELCNGTASGQQTGQSSDDYDYMTQQSSKTPDQEFESFGSFGSQEPSKGVPPVRYTQDTTHAETVRPSSGMGDVTEPQLENFLEHLRSVGWIELITGFGIRAEIKQEETVVQAVEAVLATTICYAYQDRVEIKAVLGFGIKGIDCATSCMEARFETPKLNDLDTLDMISQKNLNTKAEYSAYHGPQCREGPYAVIKENWVFKQSSLESVKEAIVQKHMCSKNKVFVNDVEEFHRAALFDQLTSDVQYKQPSDQPHCLIGYNIFSGMYQMWRNTWQEGLYPQACPPHDQFHQYKFQMDRNGEDTYKIKETYPNGQISHSTSDDYMVPLNWLSDYNPSDYCVITPNAAGVDGDVVHISTFDKHYESFALDGCPVLLSTPCEEHQYDTFAIAVKSNRDGSLAMNIAAHYKQLVINMDSESVTINNEEMEPHQYTKVIQYTDDYYEMHDVGRIYRRNGFYKLEVDDTFEVIYKEGAFYVKVADRYRGFTCGLCGDFDGEPGNDVTAPNGCLVNDINKLVKLWTPSTSFDCNAEEQPDAHSCIKEEALPYDYYTQYQLRERHH